MIERYTDYWEQGMYRCCKCSAQLFPSGSKFKSGTQWLSFREALPGAVQTKQDYSLGMVRTEILCKKCGQHLGPVFDDGKIIGDKHPQAGKRFYRVYKYSYFLLYLPINSAFARICPCIAVSTSFLVAPSASGRIISIA